MSVQITRRVYRDPFDFVLTHFFQTTTKPTNSEKNELNNIISLKIIKPTWIQVRNTIDEIIFSKLMNINDVYNYSIKDNFAITSGNAGNIIVSNNINNHIIFILKYLRYIFNIKI